jgi:radical SAM protein with 4Fe4S-binding SPASM domain
MGSVKRIRVEAGGSDFVAKMRNLSGVLRKGGVVCADVHLDVRNPPDFRRIRPLLYGIINRFERSTSIIFHDIPYCVLPDAEEHVVNLGSEEKTKFPMCRECKFGSFCGGFPKSCEDSEKSFKPVPDVPQEVSIEVTTRCNLDCDFCFTRAVHGGREREPDSERIFSMIEQMKSLGVRRLRFTGGEPMLREDLGELIARAKANGLEVWLNTNGTIDGFDGRFLAGIDRILIPVHHATDESRITGKRTLREKLRNVRKISRSGSGTKVTLGTVITGKNIGNLRTIHTLSQRLGLEWLIFRLMSNRIDGTNTPQEIRKFHETMSKLYAASGTRNIMSNAFPFCFFRNPDKARLFSLGGFMNDGRKRMIVDAMGRVKPSYYSMDVIGSFKNIRSAWGSETMKKLRHLEYLPTMCRECAYKTICRGGSRVMAREIFGSYRDRDPLLAESGEGMGEA